MMIQIPALLSPDEVADARALLAGGDWVDGRVTAGAQSALAKRNLQIPEDSPQARALGETILAALGRNPLFVSAALPLKVFPPLFNRYDAGMKFDEHVDNAIRFAHPSLVKEGANIRYRTDLSATLFLSDPDDYDGGGLIIEDTYGEHEVKLAAGDLILYPASSLHRVAPIVRGSRWASFFWIQSMVRDASRRALLFDLDQAVQALGGRLGGGDPQVVALTGAYHNLLRMWAEV